MSFCFAPDLRLTIFSFVANCPTVQMSTTSQLPIWPLPMAKLDSQSKAVSFVQSQNLLKRRRCGHQSNPDSRRQAGKIAPAT
jgi:hypothetical protein